MSRWNGLSFSICLAALAAQVCLAPIVLAGTKSLGELCEESDECMDGLMCVKTDGPGGVCDPKCSFGESCVEHQCVPAESHCTLECLSDEDCAAISWVCHGVIASLVGEAMIFQICWPPLSESDPTAGNPPFQFCGADDPLGYCNSGICLTNLSGKDRCTSFCEEDDNCPEIWHCAAQTLETTDGDQLDTTVCRPGPRPSAELVESLGEPCSGTEDCPEGGLCVASDFGAICSFVCADDAACGCVGSTCPQVEYECSGFAPIAGGYLTCNPLQDPNPGQPYEDVGSTPGADTFAHDAGGPQPEVSSEADGGSSGDGSGFVIPYDPGLPCQEDADCPDDYVCVTATSGDGFCAQTGDSGGGGGAGCDGCVVQPDRPAPVASPSWLLLMAAGALLWWRVRRIHAAGRDVEM